VEDETKTTLKCYVSQQKGFVKYIDKKYIKKKTDNFKIITARANGKNKCFGNSFIGKPNEVHTKSYISFDVKDGKEAESLLSFMKCKLPNFMLSLRKISQDISESTCKWIPVPTLNRIWTDTEVYKYFKLNDAEIELVKNTKIAGYKDLEKIKTFAEKYAELKKRKSTIIAKFEKIVKY
jgi:site-specific DNA-methyltransferase (adenine-specific)